MEEWPMAEIRDEVCRMRRTLLAAADQFSQYADYHLAKKPPDREKAETNSAWAMRCRVAAVAGEHAIIFTKPAEKR
jgi:hypothetical protein